MTRLLLVLGTQALFLSSPTFWWMGKAAMRGFRERHTPGAVLRAGLSVYAAVVTMLAVVSAVMLFWVYGLGLYVAMFLAPFALSTWVSAEVLWEEHPQAAGWVAAVPLGVASLGLEQYASYAGWLHAIVAVQVLLAAGALLHARRALQAPLFTGVSLGPAGQA